MEKIDTPRNNSAEEWEVHDDEPSELMKEIRILEERSKDIQRKKEECIRLLRETTSDSMDDEYKYGIFEERADYELDRLDREEYYIDTRINSLKNRLSK